MVRDDAFGVIVWPSRACRAVRAVRVPPRAHSFGGHRPAIMEGYVAVTSYWSIIYFYGFIWVREHRARSGCSTHVMTCWVGVRLPCWWY